jgi:tRNA U34 5-methylaminomethyl-2-thiouridine-forming methyltransferase MnmC
MDLATLTDLNSFLSEKGYFLELTADGSPTLRWGQGESMHHSGGAASESIYIYQTALDFFFSLQKTEIVSRDSQKEIGDVEAWLWKSSLLGSLDELSDKITVMSLGFGLGYNELIVSMWALSNNIPANKIRLVSYEKDHFLYEEFQKWLESSEKAKMTVVYDLILNKIIEFNLAINLTVDDIKTNLRQWLLDGCWEQESALQNVNQINDKFNIFLFDAFSNKTTPHLWESNFLDELLKNKIKAPCVFSTYACRGELKRTLAANDFRVVRRQGFKGKRDATLAFLI